MKKLILVAGAVLFLAVSCSKEEVDTINDAQNLLAPTTKPSQQYDIYKGVFTTLAAGHTGTVIIQFAEGSNTYPTAILTLKNGDVYEAKALKPISASESTKGLLFQSQDFSFVFSMMEDGISPILSYVTLNGMESDIQAAKETESTTVETRTGTWGCTVCNDSPYIHEWMGTILGGINDQSFNLIIASHADGSSSIITQVTLNSAVYIGVGHFDNEDCEIQFQMGCEREVCNMTSGDGFTTTVGYMANGNPVTWSAERIDNFACPSIISGTWQWPSISYGLIEGVFESDAVAPCCE
ncbi:hypothetical protein POV27_10760 [Aureisphaera galaxeae]|uniref:hypothetical protein n=1 Tax=Aureisphaera galaxeae TaxID=1538023 RepID=UPI002350BE85|nr:hypothetical protein [Aureisphaera galaxeae]MDC8004529.1 hypothetical protein [Aureisphaera galaxeae]